MCCLAAALLIAWKLLHVANYGYSYWYDQLDIAAHIDQYAPQNRQNKTGFELTDRAEHEALFTAIGVAVNQDGDGLRELRYSSPDNPDGTILLTDAEAIHLEDVAILINRLVPVGWAALVLLLVLTAVARLLGWAMPGIGVSLITLACIAVIAALIIVIVGADDVFSAMHEAVFPDDHQWFFYYQDSLMTTLMKAPDIFFAIGGLWALLAAGIFIAMASLLHALGARATR